MAAQDTTLNIGEQIAKGITDGLTALQRPKVAFGVYDPKTAFHPRKKDMKKLSCECFQNGTKLHEKKLFNQEIELLNQIERPGRYLDRIVEVVIRDEGNGAKTKDIRYANKTVDQRMSLSWKSFGELLEKIVAEQNALLEEETQPRAARR